MTAPNQFRLMVSVAIDGGDFVFLDQDFPEGQLERAMAAFKAMKGSVTTAAVGICAVRLWDIQGRVMLATRHAEDVREEAKNG